MAYHDRPKAQPSAGWYKPPILRVPSLLLVFAISASLIGVLDYAARTLPNTEKGNYGPKHAPALLHLAGGQTVSTSVSSNSIPQIFGTNTPGAYVHTSSSSATANVATPTTSPGAYVHTSSLSATIIAAATTTATLATNPSAYVQTTPFSTVTPGAPPSSAYVQTVGGTVTSATSQGAYVHTTTPINTPVFTTAPGNYVHTTSPTPPLVGTTPSGNYVHTTLSAENSQASNATHSSKDQDSNIPSWPLWKVFVGGYLPVFLAILFKMFWTSIYSSIKLVEPFIQLSRPTGALAKDAFWSFYLSSNITPDPIVSLFKGRWLMFWTSIVYLVVGFLPALASESVSRDTRYNCPNPDPTQPNNPCFPRLSVDITIIHLLQGLLSFVAVMTLTIMYMILRSPTGISADPSSIAFVATLLHHPDVLYDFRRISVQAGNKEIASLLGKKSYRLGDYLGSDGLVRYGIIPGNPNSYSLLENDIGTTHTHEKKDSSTRTFKNFLDVAFVLFILGLLGVVLAYYKDGSNDGFNRFFNSNDFGPRFFMSAMGSIIAMNLKRLEREVQTLSPFQRLAKSPSPAGPTIFLRKYNIPFSAIVMLLAQGHIFSASMAFVELLSEVLVVVLAAIPFSPGEIFLELIVCSYTSFGILSFMLLVLICLVFWRRRLPYLPRPPDTLGGVISYICASRMLYSFDQCTGLGNRKLGMRITRMGKMYTYGKYVGLDGQVRWMIEESNDYSLGEK